MADIIDNAAEIEELQRNLSLQNTNPDSNAPSATHCCECGDPIDERRRPFVDAELAPVTNRILN